jgi:hypothetical protein
MEKEVPVLKKCVENELWRESWSGARVARSDLKWLKIRKRQTHAEMVHV